MDIKFFKSESDFCRWLEANHATAAELWVGFYKVDSGRPSITWPESVDQALCFGWIDGLRKSIDDISYKIRFSARRPRSIWSAVNIRRAEEMIRLGLMRPTGIRAFKARLENRSGIYAYEQRTAELPELYAEILRANSEASKFFAAQTPSYRKRACWYIVSAKTEATRLKRLHKIIDDSANGRRI